MFGPITESMRLGGPRSKGDAHGPTTGLGAAALVCHLCDIHTRSDVEGKWRELVQVYEQRRNDDNLREILDLSAPRQRVNDLNGWHLERMAVGELGGEMSAAERDVALIRQESRRTKQTLQRILANGEAFRVRREEVIKTMVKQRDVLLVELEKAKEFLEQIHTSQGELGPGLEFPTPAPVEQRLLATVKPPEASATVDLSAAPSI